MITGMEWIFIILVVVTLLIWGPKKIPELARGLGQARSEFERASKLPPVEMEKKSEDVLIETARKLGIQTEGKTKAEISAEIVAMSGASKKVETEKTGEDILTETARMLGIQTEGKTKAEISAEIVALSRGNK